jgi:hypothetical protein
MHMFSMSRYSSVTKGLFNITFVASAMPSYEKPSFACIAAMAQDKKVLTFRGSG